MCYLHGVMRSIPRHSRLLKASRLPTTLCMYTWCNVQTDTIISLWCSNTAPAASEPMKHLVIWVIQACKPQLQYAVILHNSDKGKSITFYYLWHLGHVQHCRDFSNTKTHGRESKLLTLVTESAMRCWHICKAYNCMVAVLKQKDLMSADRVSRSAFVSSKFPIIIAP